MISKSSLACLLAVNTESLPLSILSRLVSRTERGKVKNKTEINLSDYDEEKQ